MRDFLKSDFFQEYKEELGVTSFVLILLIINAPRLGAYFQAQSLKQEIYKSGLERVAQIEAEDMVSDEANLVAIERIERGCLPIFQLDNPGSYIALTPGQPVIKGNYAEHYAANPTPTEQIPLSHIMPAGMCVADPYGNTGMLKPSPVHERPVVADVLTTTDEQAIETIKSQATDAYIPQLKGGPL